MLYKQHSFARFWLGWEKKVAPQSWPQGRADETTENHCTEMDKFNWYEIQI
jgi:hypothetical protein